MCIRDRIETGLLSEPRLNYSLLLGPSEIRKVLWEKALALGVELLEGNSFRNLMRDPASSKVVGAEVETNGEVVQIRSDVVVGADGYKSRVREQFGVKTKERTYPAVAAFFLEHEHGLDHMKLILGDGSQMVVLPCTRNRLNLAYTENGLTTSQLGRNEGLEYVMDKMVKSAPFLKDAIEQGKLMGAEETALFIEPKVIHVDSWVVDGGILMGDAAHSYHPGTGLGAQAAFMDAAVLGPILTRCARDGDFSLSRLKQFETERRPLVNFQEATNSRNISWQLSKGTMGKWLRNRSFRAAGRLIKRKEFQEIISGMRPPTRGETFRIMASTLLP